MHFIKMMTFILDCKINFEKEEISSDERRVGKQLISELSMAWELKSLHALQE